MTNDHLLASKLAKLKEIETDEDQRVLITSRIDLTVQPFAKGASFPYHDYTPYCQKLSKQQLLNELGVYDHSSRQVLVNESSDVSSSDKGICIVTRTILLSNSHAGTHCDQPGHFVKSPTIRFYDDKQYNGPCYVLDLSNVLSIESRAITSQLLKQMLETVNLQSITRLLICTRTTNLENWTNDFAHFTLESAKWIREHLPNIVLIAIDTPSVDSPSAAPIIDSAHGQFWEGRIAIMENISFSSITHLPRKAYLQTIWNSLQETDDARGCFVFLYPLQ
jgi:kynurenine formamidase